jgi:hypothetical protein
VAALKAKYADEDFEDPDVHVVFVMKEGDNEKKKEQPVKPSQPIMFNGKVAEEVGFDKIRKQLAQLEDQRSDWARMQTFIRTGWKEQPISRMRVQRLSNSTSVAIYSRNGEKSPPYAINWIT